jgi:hypothetical protein
MSFGGFTPPCWRIARLLSFHSINQVHRSNLNAHLFTPWAPPH